MIEVRELTKDFSRGGGRTLRAVDKVSFRVPQGEVYGLLGPNGAGKTTTLRMLLGLLTPTSGWARVDTFRSDQQPEEIRRRVGLVAAGTGVYQYLTAREMLLFFADVYGVPPHLAEEELTRLSPRLGLTEFLDQTCSTLSTGQRQRVQLARALIHRPPVLLLDEPTLGLDVLGSRVIEEYIGLLRCEGKSVIVCTHHLDEAERMCSRFGLMHRGRLILEGTLAELQERTGCRTLVEMFINLSVSGPLLSAAKE
jgi:ABC-2 type transport system ATP-binding protein/sodium transport system ATP-binding protein